MSCGGIACGIWEGYLLCEDYLSAKIYCYMGLVLLSGGCLTCPPGWRGRVLPPSSEGV